jgi:hypothetical protein
VEGIWRPLSADERQVAFNLLEDASALIREVEGVPDRIASGALGADTLKIVAKNMVRRALRNPDLLTQETLAADDGSISRSYGSSAVVFADDGLYITDSERARLVGFRRRQQAFTITPGPARW